MCSLKEIAMQNPISIENQELEDGTTVLRSWTPIPGLGVLPVNAFLIKAPEPVLIDTGLAALHSDFMEHLQELVDLRDLSWIWLTHTDADHVGNLAAVLAEAPKARVVTTFLGMGKLGLLGLPVERCFLLNPGQRLAVGDRELLAVTPPSFDAPETTGLFDAHSGYLYSADCFGALLDRPYDVAADVPADALEAGLVTWAGVDAPWLRLVDERLFDRVTADIRSLRPRAVLGSHLPPAVDMLDTLLGHLRAARGAPAFTGPDQAALEQMMAGASAA
jgi:glyoxylase-like metal-dependent hydrolase (beta-lactamase superfamily II)